MAAFVRNKLMMMIINSAHMHSIKAIARKVTSRLRCWLVFSSHHHSRSSIACFVLNY